MTTARLPRNRSRPVHVCSPWSAGGSRSASLPGHCCCWAGTSAGRWLIWWSSHSGRVLGAAGRRGRYRAPTRGARGQPGGPRACGSRRWTRCRRVLAVDAATAGAILGTDSGCPPHSGCRSERGTPCRADRSVSPTPCALMPPASCPCASSRRPCARSRACGRGRGSPGTRGAGADRGGPRPRRPLRQPDPAPRQPLHDRGGDRRGRSAGRPAAVPAGSGPGVDTGSTTPCSSPATSPVTAAGRTGGALVHDELGLASVLSQRLTLLDESGASRP